MFMSETEFQENLVQELTKYKWEAPDFLNGNKHTVTVADLITNWRTELNRINAHQLEGVELTDNEFNQVITKVNNISNSYEAAKILAIENSTGKIDGINRDEHPKVTKKQITLTIFTKSSVAGGDSHYQIAREIKTKNNKFDIVLLINGLPLINIELKRTDINLNEAFGQFKRYYREHEYESNFMAFSQMMVIMSEVSTGYFATPKNIESFNPSFIFHWADKNNNPINDWKKVVEHFLMIPMAHKLVADYLIINEAENKENQKHMLMRSYQIHALQAIKLAATGNDNPEKIPHGGYIWHTTGSGKTVTSFKTAKFLSEQVGFSKVIFLVDRRELDNNTTEQFKAFAKYDSVSVDNTSSTNKLKEKLFDKTSKIVITTTFKLNSLVKDLNNLNNKELAKKQLVFIIDEAHRTTMGDMMVNIKKYFKTSLFYGFTGTPLFSENNAPGRINEKSELIATTEQLFGPQLHKYTIDQGIADGNVLGFHVDYINTGEFESYDYLKEKIIEYRKNQNHNQKNRDIERTVMNLSNEDIEKEAIKINLLSYNDETHIPQVVKEILSNWEYQSQEKKFNAILTVAYKKRVIKYYDEFKKQLAQQDYKINIAMTFSFGNENEIETEEIITPERIDAMFEDYEQFTGLKFIRGDLKNGESAYFQDIIDRGAKGGSGRNEKNIDLIIVADQLLTGYDAPLLNTLYVDRSLELQGLIQAYSRTNRIYGKLKEFGTIVNFQYPALTKKSVDEALILYGSGGKNTRVIVDTYQKAVQKFVQKINELRETLQDPTEWATLKSDGKAKENFIKEFREAFDKFNTVTQYYEYKWNDETFQITENDWRHFLGAYENLKPSTPGEDDYILPNKLLGKIKLEGSQIIDAGYILSLIASATKSSTNSQKVDDEQLKLIYENIKKLSNIGNDKQALLLKEFVKTELVPGRLSSNLDINKAFQNWIQAKIEKDIINFAQNWGLDETKLKKAVNQYLNNRQDNISYEDLLNNIDIDRAKIKLDNPLEYSIKLTTEELPIFLKEINIKYN